MFPRACLLSLLGVVLIGAVGCSESQVTWQHYEMIVKDKSTKLEVEKTLGDTYLDRGDHWEYDEEKRHLSVFVYFDGRGVVTRKEWIDGKSGRWDGAAPGIDEKPQGKKTSDETTDMTIEEP